MNNFSWTLWTALSGLESIAFVLAALLTVLALAWGKAGLKKMNRRRENLCWRAAAFCALAKFGLMAVTLTWNLVVYFKR